MTIYDAYNQELLSINVNNKSYRYRSIMKDNSVTLYYSLVEHVELPVGSYIEFQGERYTLWRPENFKKQSRREFEYTVIFGGWQEMAKKFKYKLLSAIPHKLKFELTAKPAVFLQLFVENMNLYDGGWSVGACIDAPPKTIAFNHEFCYNVLNRLAEEFNTEWEFQGKTVNFCKVEKFKSSPLVLSYGKGNGFKSGVGRVNEGDKSPATLLYVQGGERNIDFSKYGSKTLLLPKSQTLVYQGHAYQTDPEGMYITRADSTLSDISEDSVDCSDIYPKRVGTVTKSMVVDKDGNEIEAPKENELVFYDFIDETIPDNLDYSQYRIAGEKATVIFQTGMLAGKEFDLEQTDDELTGYVHEERRFKIVAQEIDGIMMPSADWKIQEGDEYAIFNISLPEAYICDNPTQSGASWDMFREGARCLYERENPSFTFSGELDGIWSKANWLVVGGKILPGAYVQFSDEHFQPNGILIRTTGVKDYINKPYSPQLELSNLPVAGTIVNDLGKIDADEVTTENLYKDAIAYTKRRFRDARETQSMLENAFLGFSKGINPVWVQTMSLLVGSESLQFRFVNSKTDPQEIDHQFVYNNATEIFSTEAGILQHMTYGITTSSPVHKPSEYRFWDMAPYVSPPLSEMGALYFYSKCEKEGTKGEFILTEEAFRMDPKDGYLYFLTGTLGSESEGERSFVSLYGFTEIGPGWVRTQKLISADGLQFWDMLSHAFKIGDEKSYLAYNVDGDKRLVLKGTMYQSPSGETDYQEIDRGAWRDDTVYYPGDKVSYEGSVYKCIQQTEAGIAPSDMNYWKTLVARGDWVTYVFKKSETKPDKPTGENPYPSGWVDAPDSDGIWWMCMASVHGETGKVKEWSEPVKATGEDGSGIDNKYAKNSSSTTSPDINKSELNPKGWTDTPPSLSTSEYLWMSTSKKSFDQTKLLSPWSTPVRISGEAGSWTSYVFKKSDTKPVKPAGTAPIPSGWVDAPSGDGVWWMSKSLISGITGEAIEWSEPVRATGKDGNGIDNKYAKNYSMTDYPGIDVTALNPSGWVGEAPALSTGEYLWWTQAKKNIDGTKLLTNWSTPVRISGEKGDKGDKGNTGDRGPKGDTGYPGNPGPSPIYRGQYSNSTVYWGDQYRTDVVKSIVFINNEPQTRYYIARTDNGGPFSGINPTNASYWREFGSVFESVATQLLLAEWANVAGFIFNDAKLYSQDVDKTTGEANICLNGRTGEAIIKKGVFYGYIQTPFIKLKDSDATVLVANRKFKIKDNLNIICGEEQEQEIVLPSSKDYNGKHVNVYNCRFPPYTKADTMYTTTVTVEGGDTICTAQGVPSVNYMEPTSLTLIGGMYEFIGVPKYNYSTGTISGTKWIALNYSNKQ